MYIIAFNDLLPFPVKKYTDKESVLELVTKGYTVYNIGSMQIAQSVGGELLWKDVEECKSLSTLPDYSEII